MLGEDEIQKILSENYLVLVDTHSGHTGVTFGIQTWIYSPEGKEITNYWWGTGPIRKKEQNHYKRVKEVANVLTKAVEKWNKTKAKQPEQIRKKLDCTYRSTFR